MTEMRLKNITQKKMQKKKNKKWFPLLFTPAVLVMCAVLLAFSGCGNVLPKNSRQERESEVSSGKDIPGDAFEETKTHPQETEQEAVPAANVVSYMDTVRLMNAGETVDIDLLEASVVLNLFYSAPITAEINQRINGISYKENPDIALDELSYLRMLYYGFDDETHVGEMIVNETIAEDVLEIFKELYQNKYPLEKMILVDAYLGDDESSMEENNTSAFNYRMISGSSKLSNHSFGMAVDLNPRYNPYVRIKQDGTVVCQPSGAARYADRNLAFEYKITKDDFAYQLFTQAGFTWGGDWNSVKDYQHFEKAN